MLTFDFRPWSLDGEIATIDELAPTPKVRGPNQKREVTMEWVDGWKSGATIIFLTLLGAFAGCFMSIVISAAIILPAGMVIGRNLDEWLEVCALLLSLFFAPFMVGFVFFRNGMKISN